MITMTPMNVWTIAIKLMAMHMSNNDKQSTNNDTHSNDANDMKKIQKQSE